ncbi:MAG: hypothetical protein KJP06_08320 [Deltaproteobacteria bacterium]|nr:hypothetical protein [Deltaproteobacteria bacterium]
MKPLRYSITINLALTIKGDDASVRLENVDLIPSGVMLPDPDKSSRQRARFKPKKKTTHDIILQTARKYVLDSGQNKFTGAKLFNLSLVRHPELKRNTFAAQMIAAASNHPSQRHYSNRKDFFTYLGKGSYRLKKKYLDIPADKLVPPSDQVRDHVKRKYVVPAKKAGKKSLSIRAGDIHRELGFTRRIPVVCSALRSRKFQNKCDIKLAYIDGHNNTTTTKFTYRLKKK